MARKPTKKQLHEYHLALVELVQTTLEGGFVYTDKATHDYLIEQGHAEVNPDMVDESGDVATRATDAGIAHIQALEVETSADTAEETTEENQPEPEAEQPATAEPTKSESKKMSIEIEQNVAVPAVSGRGRKSSMYPFDDMQIGDSFFVEATEAKPDPAKSMASTVAGANARYAEPTGEMRVNRNGKEVPATVPTRRYIVRSVEGGARVWRVAVE